MCAGPQRKQRGIKICLSCGKNSRSKQPHWSHTLYSHVFYTDQMLTTHSDEVIQHEGAIWCFKLNQTNRDCRFKRGDISFGSPAISSGGIGHVESGAEVQAVHPPHLKRRNRDKTR